LYSRIAGSTLHGSTVTSAHETPRPASTGKLSTLTALLSPPGPLLEGCAFRLQTKSLFLVKRLLSFCWLWKVGSIDIDETRFSNNTIIVKIRRRDFSLLDLKFLFIYLLVLCFFIVKRVTLTVSCCVSSTDWWSILVVLNHRTYNGKKVFSRLTIKQNCEHNWYFTSLSIQFS